MSSKAEGTSDLRGPLVPQVKDPRDLAPSLRFRHEFLLVHLRPAFPILMDYVGGVTDLRALYKGFLGAREREYDVAVEAIGTLPRRIVGAELFCFLDAVQGVLDLRVPTALLFVLPSDVGHGQIAWSRGTPLEAASRWLPFEGTLDIFEYPGCGTRGCLLLRWGGRGGLAVVLAARLHLLDLPVQPLQRTQHLASGLVVVLLRVAERFVVELRGSVAL